MSWLKLALGLGSGISWITYAVVAGIGLAIGTAGTAAVEELRIHALHSDVTAADAKTDAANAKADAANKLLDMATAQNVNLSKTVNGQQVQMDALDAKAKAISADQSGKVTLLTEQRRAAQNQTSQILDSLKGQIDVKTVFVSPDVVSDFDPVVRRGIAWLQCLQSARTSGLPAASCAGGPAVSAGAVGASRPAAGARRYAPSVNQQLWLLGLVYRFRDWGVACYDDKAAISASEAAGPAMKETTP